MDRCAETTVDADAEAITAFALRVAGLRYLAACAALSTLSKRIGNSRIRTSLAWYTAFAMAAAIPVVPSSPIPFTPRGLTIAFSSRAQRS